MATQRIVCHQRKRASAQLQILVPCCMGRCTSCQTKEVLRHFKHHTLTYVCPGAELLQKHLQLRGEKAGEFVLHAGDVRAVTELRLACVRVAGGALQAGPGLGAGSSQRAVDALRRLLAALGVTLGARCEPVDADDTVESAPRLSQVVLVLRHGPCARVAHALAA